MKIGDNVRFLNATGGGRVVGFQGKGVVLVEDAEGFQIPTLEGECVVVGQTDAYNFERPYLQEKKAQTPAAEEEKEPADAPVTFKAAPVERRGAELLNVYLGFIPVQLHTDDPDAFELYVVNDCNYYVRFQILQQEGKMYNLLYEGEVEPNITEFVAEISREELNALEHLTMQITACKRGKAFAIKSPISKALRIDVTRFFKMRLWNSSDFFEEPSYLIPVVRNDI